MNLVENYLIDPSISKLVGILPPRIYRVFILLGFLIQSCSPSEPVLNSETAEISIFAAASLRDSLLELGKRFRDEGPDVELIFNLAGSNTLAQQILAAPKADLFLSANEHWMDRVEKEGKTYPLSRVSLLSNTLVIVSNDESNWNISDPSDLCHLDFRFLSIAEPNAVPAGRYAKAWLKGITCSDVSLWETVRERVAGALDVRAALNLVKSDRSIIGIVYGSDATVSTGIRVLYEVDPNSGPDISYSMAILAERTVQAETRAFYRFLLEPDAAVIFRRYGFMTKSP